MAELFGDSAVDIIIAEQPLTLSLIIIYAICIYSILIGTTIAFTYILGINHLISNDRLITTLIQTLIITGLIGPRLNVYVYNPELNINYEIVVQVMILASMAYTVLKAYKRVDIKSTIGLVVSQVISIEVALAFSREIDYLTWCSKEIGQNRLLLYISMGIAISFIVSNFRKTVDYYNNFSLTIINVVSSVITIIMIITWLTCINNLGLSIKSIVGSLGIALILMITFAFTASEHRVILDRQDNTAVIVLLIPHILYVISSMLNLAGGWF